MDKEAYENLKYIRSSLRGQLRGKYHYHSFPLRANWEAEGLARVVNTETGESSNPPDWVMWALVAWATSIFWLPILVFLLK